MDVFLFNLLEYFNNNVLGIVTFFDMDKNGDISRGEFLKNALKLFPELTKDETIGMFKHLDNNEEGSITSGDFKAHLIRVLNIYNKENENDKSMDEFDAYGGYKSFKKKDTLYDEPAQDMYDYGDNDHFVESFGKVT